MRKQQCGVATPGVSSQCATFGPSLSRRPGMEPTPRNTFLRLPPPCHTAITFVSEMCGNGGARPREGSPAKWAREARRPDGLERWLVSRTLLVSKHQLPFNLTFVLIQSVFIQNPSLERLQASWFCQSFHILILPILS